jgi:hypothetical protein
MAKQSVLPLLKVAVVWPAETERILRTMWSLIVQ